MAIESITKTLGTGSGIDTAALVQQLVEVQFQNRNARLKTQNDTLNAQISAVGELKSAITGFASALETLAKGGSLGMQPTSSNASLLAVSGIAGKDMPALNAGVEISQIATSQVAYTDPVADPAVAVGTGKLTISFGTATVSGDAMTAFTAGGTSFDVDIDAAHSSLQGVADAINAKNAGITASIVTDSNGARLVLKGATGAAQAFTMTATEDAGAPGLAQLNMGVGATSHVATAAGDAIVAVDGVVVTRATNTIEDLIPGVRLDLISAQPGTTVRVGSTPPTASLKQAASDFVDTYNQLQAMLKRATDPQTGALRNDPAAKSLERALRALTSTVLVTGAAAGAPTMLSEIGIATNRDGTLKLDSAQLDKALASNIAGVEAMFHLGTAATGDGLPAALNAIAKAAADTTYGLGASETRYTKQQSEVADEQADAVADADALKTRMTQQFASMDAKVAAYKATQTFLQQQIDAWNAQAKS